MAGPLPTYLTTQLAAQAAFNVPFGLITQVNAAIVAATAAGQFNTTVDCSLFVAEDVSNLRIYLDSEGYEVQYARDSNNKSLLIDWSRFLDIPGSLVAVTQGTTPWIVSGSITTSPDVNVHDGAGNAIGSVGTSLNVDVTNFPAVQPISGTTTALQGTSPWVVSGTITTSPNVNVHDGTGNSIGSTSGSLNVDVTNTVPVTLASTTITGNVTVIQPTGANLHVDVDNFPATQPVSGTIAVTQSTSPWIISGVVTESNIDRNFGTWTYYAGVSGTVIVSAGQRVLGITAFSSIGGTITIAGGATITVPPNVSFAVNPLGNLTAPTVVFTGTASYFIEVVS